MFSRFFFLFSRWSCPEILFASDMVILYLFCFAYIQSKTFRRAGTKHIKQDTFKSIRKTEYILHIWNDNFDLSLFFYPFLSLPPICFLTLCIIHDHLPVYIFVVFPMGPHPMFSSCQGIASRGYPTKFLGGMYCSIFSPFYLPVLNMVLLWFLYQI